jgi:hypothetical protein
MTTRLEGAKYRAAQNATLRSEYGYDIVALLNSLDDKTADLVAGRIIVEPLGVPTVALSLQADTNANTVALTETCRRISMRAVGAACRYKIGTGYITATTSDHYIGAEERLDIAVPLGAYISVIRAGSTNAVIEITELS